MGYRLIQKKMRQIISFILIFVFMFTGFYASEGYAVKGKNIQPNAYIQFGGYRGTDLLWRVIEQSEDGLLLWSENIITYKARNAKSIQDGQIKFSSGDWNNSSLQTWLNSNKGAGKVAYQGPGPRLNLVTSNAYNKEAGFLANFTGEEQDLIIAPKKDENNKVFLLTKEKLEQLLQLEQLLPSIQKKSPTDVALIYQETPINDEFKASYWLEDAEGNNAYIFHKEGTGYTMESSSGLVGVVPAIYLKKDIDLIGSGTRQDPYKLSNPQVRPTPNILELKENASKKRYEMEMDEASMKFTLNQNILGQTKEKALPLALKTNRVTVELPANVVNEDLQVINQEVLEFNVNQESVFEQKILDIVKTKVKGFSRASSLTEFKMTKKSIADQALREFSEPLRVSLALDTGFKENKKTATYYVEPIFDEQGEIIDVRIFYTGGQVTDRTMEFYTDHFSFYIVMEANPTFKDVQGWAKPAVELLAARGIIHGYHDGEFKPKLNVNRIDFSVLLNIALEKKPLEYVSSFADVKEDYYSGHILSLNKFGILDVQSPLTGNSRNNAPNFGVYEEGTTKYRKITREETATFIANGYQYLSSIRPELPKIYPKPLTYSDISQISSKQTQENISIAEQLGIMVGYPEGSKRTFKPKNQLTRAEAAQVIVNFMKKFNKNFNE